MTRTHFNHFFVCAMLNVVFCRSLFADVDTIISLKNGTLSGLPSQYSPAELDLKAFRLRIGRHLMEFSPLIRGFFERQPYDLQVLASWYSDKHEGGVPCLALEITPKGRDYSYHVVFDLDTLHLLGISVILRSSENPPEAFTTETLHIALSETERRQIEDSIRGVP